jgi:hypothetical protein
MTESIDFDRVLPLHLPRTPTGPEPEPDDARLVWRLRGWEIGCLPASSGPQVRDWLRANGLGGRVVSLKHDITVWRRNDGRREIGYMRRDRLDRRKHPRVVIPTLVPLKAKQPILTRRAIPYFDKLQAALNAGHQGQEPLRGKRLEPPACPPCSRAHGDLVPWPCWAVTRWMPRWLEEYWNEHIAGVLEANRPAA